MDYQTVKAHAVNEATRLGQTPVYAPAEHGLSRVLRARTRNGEFQVQWLVTGQWQTIDPNTVYIGEVRDKFPANQDNFSRGSIQSALQRVRGGLELLGGSEPEHMAS